MRERPILFNADMVKAILEGRKTQTRRIIKDVNGMDYLGRIVESTDRTHENAIAFGSGNFENLLDAKIEKYVKIPCFENDIFYVRETFAGTIDGDYVYKADGYEFHENIIDKWRPSIHMPKEAARLFLRVTSVRVERLQDITAHECVLEGIDTGDILANAKDNDSSNYARKRFRKAWNKCYNFPKTFDCNPWVWVIEFERVESEVDHE